MGSGASAPTAQTIDAGRTAFDGSRERADVAAATAAGVSVGDTCSCANRVVNLRAQVAAELRVEVKGGCLHWRRDPHGRRPVKANAEPDKVDGASACGK